MKRVFVHGLGQTPAAWEKTLLSLGDGEETVCPDLAELPRGGGVNYAKLRKGFFDFCGKSGVPLDLCGLSLGGVLALEYAACHPENVRSLALIAAQYKMPKGLLKFQNVLFRFMPESMFRQAGFEKKDFLRLCGSMMELDLSASLSRIACPVLVVCGEKDAANRKASAELAGALKNAELRVIGGAGHEVNIDAPEALAEVLQDFYKKVSPQGKESPPSL